MLTVINFATPLSQTAKEVINKKYGLATVYDVRVEFDGMAPMAGQLRRIENQALQVVGGDRDHVDCIIAPNHPEAAVWLGRAFINAHIIAMGLRGTRLRPEYHPVELMKSL